MTQVAEPGSASSPAQAEASAGAAVHHWIGGRIVAGTSGRRGPVYDPATGKIARQVDFASVDELAAAVAAAKAAFPAWRATSLSKRTDILFKIRNLVEARRKELAAHLTAEHGKVPSDALGEIARGIENLEFACGIPNLLKGGFSEQVSTGVDVFQIRQPLGVVAGITPFNFPAMVPMWMFATAIATRQHVHPEAVGEGSVGVDVPRRAAARGRRARRRLQRRPRRQGGGRRDPRPPRHRRRVVRRLDPDRPLHLRDRDEERQARPGPGRGEEPHDRPAGRRHRHGRRRRGLGRLRLGRRALHGDRHDRRGRRRRRSPRRGDRRSGCRRSGSGRAATPRPRWGRSSPASIATRWRRYLDSSAAQGATVVADGREHPLFKDSDGFFLGRLADRPRRRPRWMPTRTRSSGRS